MRRENVLLIKARVRERDGMRCRVCGMTNDDHIAATGRSLDVHRTTPGSEYSLADGVCVTMCRKCHAPQPKRPKGSVERKFRFVRIPDAFVEPLGEIADHYYASLSQQVVIACVEYLERADRLPKTKSR